MKGVCLTVVCFCLVLSCAGKNLSTMPNDEMIDEVARNLKNELLKNYRISSKKVIAITSFSRTELLRENKTYSSSVPQLGVLLANSLQNEMFEPARYDLIERTRLDSIFNEYVYSMKVPVEKMINMKLKNVDYVLLGTMQKRERTIRIDSRLVSVETGKVVSIGTAIMPLTNFTNNMYNETSENYKEVEFKIYAYKDWQTVPIEIKASSRVVITAMGSWGMTSDTKECGPTGRTDNPSEWGDFRIDRNFNHGQLLIRQTSGNKKNFSMGEYTFDKNCYLECIINDNDRNNNVGAQVVKVRIYNR